MRMGPVAEAAVTVGNRYECSLQQIHRTLNIQLIALLMSSTLESVTNKLSRYSLTSKNDQYAFSHKIDKF